jgi:hypothetical protein
MGGLKVTVDEECSWLLCNGSTLTALGVLRLEEIRGVPGLTREAIMDKSKMDYLGKGFFAAQGVWFLAQILSRFSTVTLLELHILAHTLCAVALWALWWRHKPKDVNDPVSIRITTAEAAYLSYDCRFGRLRAPVVGEMQGHVAEQKEECDISDMNVVEQIEEIVLEEMEGHAVPERLRIDYRTDNRGWKSYLPRPQAELDVWRRRPDVPNRKVEEWDNSTEYQKIRRIDKAFKKDGVFMLIPGQETEHYRWQSEQPIHLNEQMIEKLKRLHDIENSEEYHELVKAHGFNEYDQYPNCQNLYLTYEVPNTPDPKLLRHRSKKSFNILLILVLAYSGMHAIMWNNKLQPSTPIEKALWKAAIVVIGAGGLLLWTLFKISARKIAWRGWIATVLGGLIFAIAVMRLFLVVEAFIGLRHVPASAYAPIPWIGYIPWPHVA